MNKLRQSYLALLNGEKPNLVFYFFPIVSLIILIAFPLILTRNTWWEAFDYTKTGEIGDTIGGITGPIIALLAALITFLAFWVQLQANKAQTKQFDIQDVANKLDSFERRFFELIKMHRDNVAEFDIENAVKGRKVFVPMVSELKFCYHVLKGVYNAQKDLLINAEPFTERDFMNISYITFFAGVGENSEKLTLNALDIYGEPFLRHYFGVLTKHQETYERNGRISVEIENGTYDLIMKYKPFCGHINKLGHYFRHLFQIVKYVDEQDDSIVTKKYDYLKTLRAQLSTHEQLLMYYNAMSSMGEPWIEKKYLSEFRMIKNIPLPYADIGIPPKEFLGMFNSLGELIFEWDEIKERTKKRPDRR
ncbi:hypothetical protein F9K33_16230 [bacterium]|nr:MAG: hypothetical protein F9K33_16230 [bacterium]